MAESVWTFHLTDPDTIPSPTNIYAPNTLPNYQEEPISEVLSLFDASSAVHNTNDNTSTTKLRIDTGRLILNDENTDGIGHSQIAPDHWGFPPIARVGVINTPLSTAHEPIHDDKPVGSAFPNGPVPLQSTMMAASPSAFSDMSVGSRYSASSDYESESAYPSPGPQAYTALRQSNEFVAQPLLSQNSGHYNDYFANPNETLCLFNDIEPQFYPTPSSPASSVSPGSSSRPVNSMQITPANYSGPIKNQILNMTTDENGIVWIVFPYSKNKEVKSHTIRCDVDKIPPSTLRDDIKTVAAAVRFSNR